MAVSTRIATFLKIWLWLMAFHSFAVGLGLIWHPAILLSRLGYVPCSEPFFPTQGGVFHIVMAVGYSMAAWNPSNFRCLVIFSIVVKVMATVFLAVYWFINPSLWVVLMSGLADGAMAIILAFLYNRWRLIEPVKE
ncbi:MAG: hypothetical protein KOO60_12490 [Gemmatimonadales bacterium]|nr:hypothetical protein [Gemmatimonadales bacterium]